MIDPNRLIPLDVIQGKSSNLASYYAPLGDYIGGVLGAVIGAITLIVVFLAWREDAYKGHREKIFQCMFELLRAHDELAKGVKRLDYKPEMDPFGGVIHEFYQIYKLLSGIQNCDKIMTINDRIGIAYIYTYYGPYSEALELSAAHYGRRIAQPFHDAVQNKRKNDQGTGYRKGYLAGHQQELSHYFRNLYTLYRYIKESRLWPEDKKLLARIARARISNYEQALLTLNIISPLGKEWAESGLIKEFEPISNVPRHFFAFDKDFNLVNLFPYVHYEWKDYYPPRTGLFSALFSKFCSSSVRFPRASRFFSMYRRIVSRK